MAQLVQCFTTDAQRFSVYQERPHPAADDVAACTSASATRSTSQLAGWPALLQPPCTGQRLRTATAEAKHVQCAIDSSAFERDLGYQRLSRFWSAAGKPGL